MKIIGKTLYGLFILLLLGVVGVFVASLLPIPGNIELKIVKSGSMEPAIHTGAIVLVKPQSDYQVGDIVTFGADSRAEIPTTHRIVAITTEGGQTFYQTKGDANEEHDPNLAPKSSVIGKVLVNVPYAGYVLDFARKPLGFTFLIGVPAGLIILDEVWKIAEEVLALRRRKRQAQFEQQHT